MKLGRFDHAHFPKEKKWHANQKSIPIHKGN
jgi:hypothetical protein